MSRSTSLLSLPWWLNPWAEVRRLRLALAQPLVQRRNRDRRRRRRTIAQHLAQFGRGLSP